MLDCMNDCMKEFVKGLGWITFPVLVACLIAAAVIVVGSAGTLALPAILSCLYAAGIGYAAVAISSCLIVCIRENFSSASTSAIG